MLGQPARLTVRAVGSPAHADAVLASLPSRALRVVARPDCVLLPPLVNAHTHLDLTHIGPQPFDPVAGFGGFVRLVISRRLGEDEAIAQSVARGAALSLRGGVVAVGDIAGVAGSAGSTGAQPHPNAGQPTLTPWRALASTALAGVSFLEFFAIGTREAANLERLEATLAPLLPAGGGRGGGPVPMIGRVRLGLSPHAPYTVGPRAYAAARALARRTTPALAICTHLAETPAEREFIARGDGPFADFLRRIGLWSEQVRASVGEGLHPIEHLREVLELDQPLLAHVNDLPDAQLPTLARSGASVVYCPRSSDYFRNHEHFGPHRYRDMLAAGVPVCLGTDSVVNLPPDPHDPSQPLGGRLSTLDEARFLYQRDRGAGDALAPALLLAMASTHGARALGLRAERFTFREGQPLAGVLGVPIEARGVHATNALAQVLDGATLPELVVLGEVL